MAFVACDKDEFTAAPQIKFKEFDPNQGSNLPNAAPSYLIFEVTDGDGDLDTDSAKIVVKNTLTGVVDSMNLKFPDLGSALGKNFKGDVQVDLKSTMGGRSLPSTQRPYVDTIGFEVYVVDKAKNKSNVIIAQPFYFFTL